MKKTIYNAVVFNIAWLVCVLGGNGIAVLAAIVVVAVHLKYFSDNHKEIAFIALITFIGFMLDTTLIRSGWLIAPDASLWPPLWLVSLWALFATTLDHSMKWFQSRLLVSVVMGGVAGTLTYLAGTRLTDFSLKLPLLKTLAVIFIVWCVVFPLCLAIAKKMLSAEMRPKE